MRAIGEGYFSYLDLFSGGCFWGSVSTEFDDRPGPVRDAIATVIDAWLAELGRQAGIAGVEDPELYAFELYALMMGANSRYRLSGDPGVFKQARGAMRRLEAELPD